VEILVSGGGANTAAIESHNFEHEAAIEIRQVKYLVTQTIRRFIPIPLHVQGRALYSGHLRRRRSGFDCNIAIGSC
jgi:hypothetical protein